MTENTREVVGIFPDADRLEAAALALESHGFDRSNISLLASIDAVETKLGHRFERVQEIEDDSSVPRRSFVPRQDYGVVEGVAISVPLYFAAVATTGLVIAAGWPLAVAIGVGVAAGGAGAVMGGGIAKAIHGRQNFELGEQLERGGLVLWVRTETGEREDEARAILTRNGATDVHALGEPNTLPPGGLPEGGHAGAHSTMRVAGGE